MPSIEPTSNISGDNVAKERQQWYINGMLMLSNTWHHSKYFFEFA